MTVPLIKRATVVAAERYRLRHRIMKSHIQQTTAQVMAEKPTRFY
jgi:hypothetical protein